MRRRSPRRGHDERRIATRAPAGLARVRLVALKQMPLRTVELEWHGELSPRVHSGPLSVVSSQFSVLSFSITALNIRPTNTLHPLAALICRRKPSTGNCELKTDNSLPSIVPYAGPLFQAFPPLWIKSCAIRSRLGGWALELWPPFC